jgi:hypothetical protein
LQICLAATGKKFEKQSLVKEAEKNIALDKCNIKVLSNDGANSDSIWHGSDRYFYPLTKLCLSNTQPSRKANKG